MDETVSKKVAKSKGCASGMHTFIPAVWKISPNKHICDLFVCQHCMTPFSKREREIVCHHDAENNSNESRIDNEK